MDKEFYLLSKFSLKKKSASFFLVNVHARVFNQNPEQEILFFKDYLKRLNSENIFILGDFNLDENHSVWDSLYQLGFKPSILKTSTTLKRGCKNGKYLSHSIDNIYYNSNKYDLINSGIIDFVVDCDNLEYARTLSDHLPVFLECKLK